MQNNEPLAWNRYPEPDGTPFYAADLARLEAVEQLFDVCQILQAYITDVGWRFLLGEYGVPGLLEINRRSGWFNEEDDADATEEMKYHCFISGYNPDTDEFGVYDEETGLFKARE